MRKEAVEIYDDAPNVAVMRHPRRRFPGSLVQGDSLSILCGLSDRVRKAIEDGDMNEAMLELDELRWLLWTRLKHYERVLQQHDIRLPYTDKTPHPELPKYDDDAT